MQGYAQQLSLYPGQALSLCTTTGARAYRIAFRRLGATGGTLDLVRDLPGRIQPCPERAWETGCGWEPTATWTIPADARTGLYAAECTDDNGSQNHIVFTVKPPPDKKNRIAVLASTNTWNAYNGWGGMSAYSTPCPELLSLHRPSGATSPEGLGRNHLVRAELWVINHLENAGYPVDIYSDLDLHQGWDWLIGYDALVINTHGEYWSGPMRDHLDAYLNAGGNLLYLSGNGMYWKVTYDPNMQTMEVRKDKRPHLQTCEPGGLWRNVGRPEHATLGVGYVRPGYMTFAPYRVEAPKHWIFKNTGLHKGDLIGRVGINGGAASGWEMDQIGDASPANLQMLAQGLNAENYMDPRQSAHYPDPAYEWNGKGGAHMVYYDHPGGGGVFSTGSIAFGGSLVLDTKLQHIVRNVLDRFLASPSPTPKSARTRKTRYVQAVTKGAGFMSHQHRASASPEEIAFRKRIDARKNHLLSGRTPVRHPALLTDADAARIQENIHTTSWAKTWFAHIRETADQVIAQGEGYIEHMISEQTPWTGYTFVCPNCVGVKSQEASEYHLIDWRPEDPDVIRCRACGHAYPSLQYPETATLVCPRRGRALTFYQTEAQRTHPDDRSGKHAYWWARHPIHVCFSGIVRERKAAYMIRAGRALALAYRLTSKPAYARVAVRILERLTHCFRAWLYHDYWDTVADCDPLYAAWHDRALPIEWKRNLFTSAYENDTVEKAAMLQTYWGAGRLQTSTGEVVSLPDLCLIYDLTRTSDVWTPDLTRRIERDLLLEWIIEAEPFVGGPGKTQNVSNKAPRIYHAQAAVARCLGIAEFADTALRGYEAIRDRSFGKDGFCHESPSYNEMYLHQLLEIPETLHGFRWPKGHRRRGAVDLYRTDPALSMMLRAELDQLRPDGRYIPLSDTHETPVRTGKGSRILEIGLKRLPEYYRDRVPILYNLRGATPTEYAVMHLSASDLKPKKAGEDLHLPEICFPDWMTAILRHGTHPKGSLLSLSFNPPGGHRHYDNLSLYYTNQGRTILGDHGYLAESPGQQWVKHTFSHNLVIVDDQVQQFRTDIPRKPHFDMMATSPQISLVEASSQAYPQCGDYRRLIALIKGPDAATFALDIFRVKGGNRHAYRLFSELAASDAPNGRFDISLSMSPEPPLPQVGASEKQEDIFGLRDIREVANPAPGWQATWAEGKDHYRFWMLSEVNAARAANGPGREMWTNPAHIGRRVRYVEAVREGKNLQSAFVALHEPGRKPIIRAAHILPLPQGAGPDALALRLDTVWGTYRIFSQCRRPVQIDGIRFKGRFGILCDAPNDRRWLFSIGAETFVCGDLGFEAAPARWSGNIIAQTQKALTADVPRPKGWADPPEGVTAYTSARAGAYTTGFPVRATTRTGIAIDRFALPPVTRFECLEVRYCET